MPNFTCTNPSFAPGTVQFAVVLRADPAVLGTHDAAVQTSFSVSAGASNETDTSDNSETETTQYVTPDADVSVTATDSPDPVTAGGDLTYTIDVVNGGPDAATNATLSLSPAVGTTFQSIAAPPGWTCTPPPPGTNSSFACTNLSFPNGGSSRFTLVVNVQSTVPDGSTIVTSASVSSAVQDPDPSDNDASVSTAVLNPRADLSMTKVDSPDPVLAGDTITYTITVNNAGPSAATHVVLTDAVPSNTIFVSAAPTQGACSGTTSVTCNLGTLALTGSATITLVVNVSGSLTAGTVISNTATVASANPDPNPGNETQTVTTTVATTPPATADLAASKSVQPASVVPNGRATFTLGVVNNGLAAATNVRFTDTLPAGLTFVPPGSGGGSADCTAAGQVVTCPIGTLGVGASASRTVVAQVTATTSVTNTVTASADQPDPIPANNSASALVTIGTNPAHVFHFDTSSIVVDETAGTVTIVVRNPSGLPGSVQFSTQDGTARAGLDYLPVSGTLTFSAGETSKTFVIPILIRQAEAPVQNFDGLLLAVTGFTLADGAQDDLRYPFSLGPTEVRQGGLVLVTFTVVLSNPSPGAALGSPFSVTVTIRRAARATVSSASPGDDDTDDPPKETKDERRQRERTNRGSKDDEYVEGNVVETRCDQPWPSVVIANRDGEVETRLVKEAQAACRSIQPGDYLEADGEKQHEHLFDAHGVEVRRNGERVR